MKKARRTSAIMTGRTGSQLLALGALILALTGCGSGDSPSAAPTDVPTSDVGSATETQDDGGSASTSSPNGEATMPSEMTTVRVAMIPGVGSLPYHVAEEQGFFEERNISTETTVGLGTDQQMQALGSQFDVVQSPIPQWVAAKSAGLDVQIFSGLEGLTTDVLTNPLITNNPELETLEDFLSSDSSIAVHPGTYTPCLLNYALKQIDPNLSDEDLNLTPIPFPDQMDQLRAGRVDALVGAVGFFEPLLDEGYQVVGEYPQEQVVAAGGELPIVFNSYGTTPSFAESNPEALRAFRDAIQASADWIGENEDEALSMFAQWVGRDPETLGSVTVGFYMTDIQADHVAPWAEIWDTCGLLEEPVDPESLVFEIPQ